MVVLFYVEVAHEDARPGKCLSKGMRLGFAGVARRVPGGVLKVHVDDDDALYCRGDAPFGGEAVEDRAGLENGGARVPHGVPGCHQ